MLLPGSLLTYALAALFAGMVSSLGPVANVLAVERFGGDGMALGAYRSVQIALGAAASAVIGLAGDVFGLRPTLAVAHADATDAAVDLSRARRATRQSPV